MHNILRKNLQSKHKTISIGVGLKLMFENMLFFYQETCILDVSSLGTHLILSLELTSMEKHIVIAMTQSDV